MYLLLQFRTMLHGQQAFNNNTTHRGNGGQALLNIQEMYKMAAQLHSQECNTEVSMFN